MLNQISDLRIMAEAAVKDGDDTLKKANNTYHLLQSFSSEVQKSSEAAEIALRDVPAIRQQIRDTEDIIRRAEDVRLIFVFVLFYVLCCKTFLFQALEESYNNADRAKENAQEAQERYADQASKVS